MFFFWPEQTIQFLNAQILIDDGHLSETTFVSVFTNLSEVMYFESYYDYYSEIKIK